jgi:hypothetical protein
VVVAAVTTRYGPCENCGRENEEVRLCCTWEGRRVGCPSCLTSGAGHKPGHICGVGIIKPKGEDNGEGQ